MQNRNANPETDADTGVSARVPPMLAYKQLKGILTSTYSKD